MPVFEYNDSPKRGKKLFKERQPGVMTGVTGAKDFQNSQTEHNFRTKFSGEETAAPAASRAPQISPAAAPLATPTQEPPPTLPAIEDRLHKWGRNYVIASPDHVLGEDPVLNPAYAAGRASSIADAYAKALAISQRDNQKCALIILGHGAPWQEPIPITSEGVEIFGLGGPVLSGHTVVPANIQDLTIDGVDFTTPDKQPAFWLQPGAPDMRFSPQSGIHIIRSRFYGEESVFYAQRRFNATLCDFWHTVQHDPYALESAPCWIESEDLQTWFYFLRNCRFATYRQKESDPFSPISTNGWALRVSARRNGGMYIPTMISGDGTWREHVVAPIEGFGSLVSGVMLDDSLVCGSALIEGWTLAHRGGAVYGGIQVPDLQTSVYAIIRGHDYVTNVIERQFGILLMDDTPCHSGLIAEGWTDPVARNPLFTGGATIYFRSQHLKRGGSGVPAAASRSVGTTLMTFFPGYGASTPCALWGTGSGFVPPATPSQTNSPCNFHPLFP